jgi:hypothetical protein
LGLVLFIVEIASLAEHFDVVLDVLDFLESFLGIQILLAILEFFDLFSQLEDSLEILQQGLEFRLLPVGDVLVLKATHVVECNEGFRVDFPAIVAVEAMLQEKFVDLLLLLRVEEGVFLILKVRMTVDTKQVNRGRLSLFLVERFHLQIAASA